MPLPLRHLVLPLLLCAAALTGAQTTPAPATHPSPAPPRQLVFLDPAHGGDDNGARILADSSGSDGIPEKDVTLALSNRLRFQLDALGIAVLATRENVMLPSAVTPDGAASPTPQSLTTDQRAGLANHAHPFACIVLHATQSGSGVHILTAALPSEPATLAQDPTSTTAPLLQWDRAQASSLPQSERLATEIASALTQAGLPINRGHASIRPLNNLTCPAVLIELAPLSRTQSAADSGYQARVAQALSTALVFWRGHSAPDSAGNPDSGSAGTP